MPIAIEIKNLKKTYGDQLEALKGIDLTINEGEFFGLLGPNGAGKSTTIAILCGLVNKSSGTVSIGGFDLDTQFPQAKSMLGVVPQEFNFNIFEKCLQIVVNQGGYYGVPRSEAVPRAHMLLERLGLKDKTNTPAARLSGGLKRRLMIARALIHQPKILILDEPTAGVDISLRRSMWDFLSEINQEGLTIILTTHYLEEAENLCKQIAIIDHGKIIENAPTASLLKRLKSETVRITVTPEESVPTLPDLMFTPVEPGIFELELSESVTLTQVVEGLKAQGITVNRASNKSNRLEELFFKLVNS